MSALDDIKPGVNYPTTVEITEVFGGEEVTVRFILQSYYVGMYCAIYFPNMQIPQQVGDYDNKRFVTKLKRDIKRAIERGAEVEIGDILPVKTTTE